MANPKIKYFIISLLFVISIFLTSFVSAGVSEVGVEYDSELMGQFLVNKWVHVIVKIHDATNITVLKKDLIEVQESKDDERKAVLDNISDSVLLALSENEFQLEGKFPIGNGFYGNITKEGFDKLLKDKRVRKIYSEKELSLSLSESASLITWIYPSFWSLHPISLKYLFVSVQEEHEYSIHD